MTSDEEIGRRCSDRERMGREGGLIYEEGMNTYIGLGQKINQNQTMLLPP
jgi:hypothetical protein